MRIEDARPHIEAALSYAGKTHNFEDVVRLVEEGRAVFWPGVNSAIVTEISQYPQGKVLHFWLAGGNLAELEQMVPVIEQWGREQGCTSANLVGRQGWERVSFLKNGGWKSYSVVMEKEL